MAKVNFRTCRVETIRYRGRWRWILRELCSNGIVALEDGWASRPKALAAGKRARLAHLAKGED